MSLRHTRRGGQGGREPPRGSLADSTLARQHTRLSRPLLPSLAPSFLAILLTLYKIGPACGPRVYLRCSTSRAKYYASVLLCDHPDVVAPHCVQGRRDCGFECCAECVYTLAHAIGFVTRSLYAVPGCLSKPIYSIIFEERAITNGEQYFLSSLLTLIYCKKSLSWDLLQVLFKYNI